MEEKMRQTNQNTEPDRKQVMIDTRRQRFVTCPHCWTDQRTDRDFCYQCGVEFIYRDEQNNAARN